MKHFTIKSVVTGLIGGLFVCFAAYPNDYLIRSNLFVGTTLPFGVFCLLFLINLLYRPLSLRLPRAFRFSNGELVVAFVIMLAACSLPTSGLMRYFPQILTCPYDLYATRQNWQTYQVLKYAPDDLVPEGWYIEGEDPELDATMTPEERVEKLHRAEYVNKGFRNGITKGNKFVYFWKTRDSSDVIPLSSWYHPLLFWTPMILCFLVFMTMMMVVVHPQWSRNELLPYPIAEFTDEMLRVEGDRAFPTMWYEGKFWVGFFVVAFIHFIRVMYVWHPETMINIKLEWRLSHIIASKFPNYFWHGMGPWSVYNNKLYLGVIGFAFFIPTDVSLSLGLTNVVLSFFAYFMWSAGVNFTWYHCESALTGAYFAMFGMIIYLGRNYYARVFRAALGGRRHETLDPDVVRAARILIAAWLGMVLLGCVAGLNIWMSGMFFTSIVVLYLVLARISAESGSPLVQARWKPADFFFKLFGATAIGPYSLAIMGLLTTALASDPREALTCFLANGFKVAEREKVRNGRLAGVILMILLPCLVVAFLMALWVNYSGRGTDSYALTWPPRRTFDRVASAVAEISREPGLLDKVCRVEKTEGWFSLEGLRFRLEHWKIKPGVLPWLAFGIGAVLISYYMRLRFTWWMIHPVLFLTWNTWATRCFWASFLLGCLIKSAVVRFGGGKMYHRLKPFFMGGIMGEIVIAAAIMAFNVWYFFHTGDNPKNYYIFPV